MINQTCYKYANDDDFGLTWLDLECCRRSFRVSVCEKGEVCVCVVFWNQKREKWGEWVWLRGVMALEPF
jgi:hypothetical protein